MIVLHKLHATVLTDQGKVRTNNEDNFYFDGKGYEEPQAFCHFSEKCSTRKKPIFAVFDGMGGESYGEIASSLAVQTLRQHEKAIKHCKSEQLDAVVQEFVADANQNIYQMARNCRAETAEQRWQCSVFRATKSIRSISATVAFIYTMERIYTA